MKLWTLSRSIAVGFTEKGLDDFKQVITPKSSERLYDDYLARLPTVTLLRSSELHRGDYLFTVYTYYW